MFLDRQDVTKPAGDIRDNANIAPRTLTDAVVTIPANTSVMPNARTIGHAVGDGMASVFGASSCLFTGSSKLMSQSFSQRPMI